VDESNENIPFAWPDGAEVRDRTARRKLLEAKLRASDAIAATQTGARAREAQRESAVAFEELVRWHRADVERMANRRSPNSFSYAWPSACGSSVSLFAFA
jgi:hypothetical protein